jgi:hypothetical protein
VKITLNGKNVNMNGALPLVVSDWKALKAQGVTQDSLRVSDNVEPLSKLVLYALSKADASVTMEDIDKLTFKELDTLGGKIIHEEVVDRPFLTISTSSPVPTDGPEKT